ncbi:MAG TPA: nucleotidyltransferase domain-containing protein [Desulfuromonadales bacterium]|nr:nucleotidyltransferase domain-containing protein [Desulfuromonadales bacterium]
MDLKPEHRRIICDIFATHLPDREVRLFGSRATGTAKPNSDIDLVVMGDDPLPLTTMRILRDSFDDSDLPFQVDLVDWVETSEEFRKIIETTAIRLIPEEIRS